ncbi:hypothetical protein CRG49_002060 [Neisseria sp. N95_16]|uniref:DUF927 domain-containing protein n=1 Tax=Neisseria brasiliensis TaxID=2666100 RepID=A0A7X2GZG5_9NEIS|nr:MULTISPECIES: hypothetical protein [Neisseria]MRN38572.1 hypothetical protein [Neisseria brasiliensis]PJO10489.1 hypothetical protein CRG49_002060 [Neisseria sp. N95_16]
MNNWYFYAQHGKGQWKPYTSEDKLEVLKNDRPDFITALEVNCLPDKDGKYPKALAYRGDLYLDWDGKDEIQDVLDSVKRFMFKLENLKVDLNQLRWWLSGNKGVHCVIPTGVFLSEGTVKSLNGKGHPSLHHIYRRMVSDNDLITDHMDLSIYTGGKGRMWRVENMPRTLSDGRTTYKVPITAANLKNLDEARYWETVSEPREPIYPTPAIKNLSLSTLFSISLDEVNRALKLRDDNCKNEMNFYDWQEIPSTIRAAFNGEGISSHLDLNTIKIQLCVAAVATKFPKLSDEDAFIESIQGFIQSRVGTPGAAHQTAQQIEQCMRNGFRSIAENSCYAYTPQAFASILDTKHKDNLDYQGRDVTGESGQDPAITNQADFQGNCFANDGGVIIIEGNKKEKKDRAVSNYSWCQNSLMKIVNDVGEIQAYSVIPLIDKEERPRTTISLDLQLNTAKMCRHVMSLGGHLEFVSSQTLSQVRSAWLNWLGSGATEQNDYKSVVSRAPIVEAVRSEGIFVQSRVSSDELDPESIPLDERYNVFWVEPTNIVDGELVNKKDTDGKRLPDPLFYDPVNPEGSFGIELSRTNQTLETTRTPCKESVRALLELNGNFHSMAVMLGWFTACSLKHQLYTVGCITNFPILQVYGEAGCGKTTTMNLMLKLFSWNKDLRLNTAGDGTTIASLRISAATSTSIPLVVDEVKAQNLGHTRWMPEFRNFLQNIYTIGQQSKKAGGRAEGGHSSELVSAKQFAPVAFLGETLETSQTSLMERLAIAGFHKTDKVGRDQYAKALIDNPRPISILGWSIVTSAMNTPMSELVNLYKDCQKLAEEKVYTGSNDRITATLAMVLTGFRFFSKVINNRYGEEFKSKLESMEHALLDANRWNRIISSEVVRLLNFLSQSSYEDSDFNRTAAVKGQHYDFEVGTSSEGVTKFLLLSIDRLYTLYRLRCRSIGETPVFTSEDEMYEALRNASITVDAYHHPELGLKTLKIDPNIMEKEGVRMFKD